MPSPYAVRDRPRLAQCCKGSYGAGLWLKEMAFVEVTFSVLLSVIKGDAIHFLRFTSPLVTPTSPLVTPVEPVAGADHQLRRWIFGAWLRRPQAIRDKKGRAQKARGPTRLRRAVGLAIPCRVASQQSPTPLRQAGPAYRAADASSRVADAGAMPPKSRGAAASSGFSHYHAGRTGLHHRQAQS
jgi:hypothetical protein